MKSQYLKNFVEKKYKLDIIISDAMELFALKFKELLRFHNIESYGILADKSNIPRPTIKSYMKSAGKPVNPGYDMIFKLSRYFNISPEYFFSELSPDHYYRFQEELRAFTVTLTILDSAELEIFKQQIIGYQAMKFTKSTSKMASWKSSDN